MVSKCLLNMIEKFLNDDYDMEDFSYDFPDKIFEFDEELKNENYKLHKLITNDMPDICSNFEPEYIARKGMEGYLLDEKQFKQRVREEYEKALKLI